MFIASLSGSVSCLRIHQPWLQAGLVYGQRSEEDERLLDAQMADLVFVVYDLNWGDGVLQHPGNWTSHPEAAASVSKNTMHNWELLGGRGGKEFLTGGYSFFKSAKHNLCATVFQGTTFRRQESAQMVHNGGPTKGIQYDFSQPESVVELCQGISVNFAYGQNYVSMYNPMADRRNKNSTEGDFNSLDDMSKILGNQCFGPGTRWITAGHSQGAGMATMEAYCKNQRMATLAVRKRRLYSPYSEIYLYASPAFSDGNLVDLFTDNVAEGVSCWRGRRFILDNADFVPMVWREKGRFDPVAAVVLEVPENILLRKASESEYVKAFSAGNWQHHPCTCNSAVAVATLQYNKFLKETLDAELVKLKPLACTYLSEPPTYLHKPLRDPDLHNMDTTWHNVINYKCALGWRAGSLTAAESTRCFKEINSETAKSLADGVDGLI